MGFRVRIDEDVVVMNERQIKNVSFGSEIPDDSNARATDNGVSLKIWGKILFSVDGEGEDPTLELADWSQISSDKADCYKAVEVDVVSAGLKVRQIMLPNAFVVEYSETIDDEKGVGEFYLHVKQKKDVTDAVNFDGGFAADS